MAIRRIKTPSGFRCHNGKRFVKCAGSSAKKKAKKGSYGSYSGRSSTSFQSGNKNANALRATKGRGSAPCCDRKSVLRAVSAGASIEAAVEQYCPASCAVGGRGGDMMPGTAGWGWGW